MDSLPLFIPGLSGFVLSKLCSFSEDSSRLQISPPSVVFMIVWPLLYAIIGYVWYNERQRSRYVDVFFIVNTLLSAVWIYLFNCRKQKRIALYVLVGMLATSFMLIHISYHKRNKILLCLYSTWLIFALIMNSFVVQQTI